jgi:hypothetical protein
MSASKAAGGSSNIFEIVDWSDMLLKVTVKVLLFGKMYIRIYETHTGIVESMCSCDPLSR